MRFVLLVLVLFGAFVVRAQDALPTDTTIDGYFHQLPHIANNANEAYQLYFSKGKKQKCFESRLQEKINLLAKLSSHKSRLLSMLSKNYDAESEQFDFAKMQITKDKALDNLVHELNTQFFNALDDYMRTVTSRLEPLFRTQKIEALAEKQLTVYKEELPKLIMKVKSQLLELDNFMDVQGYNAILSANDNAHPCYIQLLEVKGIMYDRMLKLCQQINNANKSSATWMDDDKKSLVSYK